MNKYFLSIGIIVAGLLFGIVIQSIYKISKSDLPISYTSLRKLLQKIAILIINPVTLIGAIWVVNLNEIKLIALPFIGLTAIGLGGVFAFLFSRMQRMNRSQTGAYIVAGGFTNIGSIGGLLCYLYLGEGGYALVAFYSLFELISYYGFGFPIAKSFSMDTPLFEHLSVRLKKLLLDPFMIVAILSISMGLFLNYSNIQRPFIYESINKYFIPTGSLLLLTSIGMAMRFRQIGNYIKEGIIIAIIKFMIIPFIATTLAFIFGFGKMDQGLPLKTVLILSSMPVGFIALVPPTIYDLDVDLANASWFITNLSLLFVIPWLHFLIIHII